MIEHVYKLLTLVGERKQEKSNLKGGLLGGNNKFGKAFTVLYKFRGLLELFPAMIWSLTLPNRAFSVGDINFEVLSPNDLVMSFCLTQSHALNFCSY